MTWEFFMGARRNSRSLIDTILTLSKTGPQDPRKLPVRHSAPKVKEGQADMSRCSKRRLLNHLVGA
jgi:hypothetical protein